MVTESLIRKKFVHETMKEGMQKLQDAWRPAVGAFKVRSGRLRSFANHPAPMTEITGSRYSIKYSIPLHLRFLDIQYRRKKARRGEGKRNLYNKIVWPILYKEVFPELKYGLTNEVRYQIRQQLEKALNP